MARKRKPNKLETMARKIFAESRVTMDTSRPSETLILEVDYLPVKEEIMSYCFEFLDENGKSYGTAYPTGVRGNKMHIRFLTEQPFWKPRANIHSTLEIRYHKSENTRRSKAHRPPKGAKKKQRDYNDSRFGPFSEPVKLSSKR